MRFWSEVYARSPVAVQNVLVSAYGFMRARKRFGGRYDAILREAERVRRLPIEEVVSLQADRFSRLIDHVATQVPYYRDRFRELGLAPSDLRTPADLHKLPVLSRDEVRDNLARLRAPRVPVHWTTETSGSTGPPLTNVLDAYSYQLSMALLACHEALHGVGRTERRATFAGRLIQPVTDDRPPFWRYNLAENQMLCSAYHMSDRNLPAFIEALEDFAPSEIIGYPSSIHVLADFCRRQKVKIRMPLKIVVTNSETLLEWQRDVIEEYLGVPVYDYYSTAESILFAGQCRCFKYHPEPMLGAWEALDDHGHPVPPGHPGRLIATTLANFAMPLIRYDSGDVVIVSAEPCGCGRSGVVWERVLGRTGDIVITPEGRRIGMLDHVFDGVSIREAQIAQTSPQSLVLRVVPDVGYDNRTVDTLVRKTQERVGTSMDITIQTVSSIRRAPNGKFPGVVKEF